jgi:hypothetical protein
MTLLDHVWEVVDNALMLCCCIAVLVVAASAIACPVYLHLIHAELVQIREQSASCKCSDDRSPGPVLPRVLPRLRNLGEADD